MDNKTIIALFFCYFPLLLTAQPGFNLAPPQDYPKAHFRNMILDNDTIVGYGMAFSDTVEWRQGLYVAKFDSSGNRLADNFILDTLGRTLSMDQHYGRVSKASNGGYVLTAAPSNGKSALFFKLNHNLEVEFIQEYTDTVNLSHFLYREPLRIQDGYLLYGLIQRPNYFSDPFVRRVDNQGDTVWFKYYGNYNIEDGFLDIKVINDTLFVVAGVGINEPGNSYSFINYINLDGQVTEEWRSENNPEIGYLRKILPTADGGLITFGVYQVELIFSTNIVQPTLAKLDSNFQVQWVKHFGRAASLNARISFHDIEPTADGNYIAAGETVIEEGPSGTHRVGWLYKFSPQGDSIWSKHLFPPIGAEYPIRGYFGGVGELSSGSIVAGGAAYEGNDFYPWLVKVDAKGCLEEPCPVLSAIVGPAASGEEIRLFPNPNKGRFRLSWEHTPVGGRVFCTIFDAQGRVVWQEVRQAAAQMEIDATGLPPGFYWLEMRVGGRRWVGKVVVER